MSFEPKDRVRVAKCLEGWDSQHVGKLGTVRSEPFGEWVDVHVDGCEEDDECCFHIEELVKL